MDGHYVFPTLGLRKYNFFDVGITNKLDTFKLYVPFRKGLPPYSHLRTLTIVGGILRKEGDPKIQLDREETTHNILIH